MDLKVERMVEEQQIKQFVLMKVHLYFTGASTEATFCARLYMHDTETACKLPAE